MKERLTQGQIDARMDVYNELVNHLGMSIYDSDEEKRQGVIIKGQIEKLATDFYNTATSVTSVNPFTLTPKQKTVVLLLRQGWYFKTRISPKRKSELYLRNDELQKEKRFLEVILKNLIEKGIVESNENRVLTGRGKIIKL